MLKSRKNKDGLMKCPKYSLICGDSTKRSTLGKNSVDLTITSPPYNIGLDYLGGGVMITSHTSSI